MTKEIPTTNEVIAQGGGNLPAEVKADWGGIEGLETTDLLIPKIYHQQSMSKFVSEGTARPGDFCDSVTGEVLAKKDEPLSVIIFGTFKTMIVKQYDVMKNSYTLLKVVPILPDNAKQWADKAIIHQEETEHDGTLQYNMYYNYYCLLPGRLEQLPFVLSLGSTKTKAATKLNTIFYNMSRLKRPSASVVFELTSTVEKNDKGSWFGLAIAQGRVTTDIEMQHALAWYLKSKSQKFVVVEEEAKSAASSEDDYDGPNI